MRFSCNLTWKSTGLSFPRHCETSPQTGCGNPRLLGPMLTSARFASLCICIAGRRGPPPTVISSHCMGKRIATGVNALAMTWVIFFAAFSHKITQKHHSSCAGGYYPPLRECSMVFVGAVTNRTHDKEGEFAINPQKMLKISYKNLLTSEKPRGKIPR